MLTEDHPGPIARRHTCRGGAFPQSVEIETPRTTESRFAPRNPGQSPARNTTALACVVAIRTPDDRSARYFSSADRLHRHRRSANPCPLSPSIRNSPNTPVERNSSTIKPISHTRCGAFRATTSHSAHAVSIIGNPLITGNGPIVR
jgi:hypothetical protein